MLSTMVLRVVRHGRRNHPQQDPPRPPPTTRRRSFFFQSAGMDRQLSAVLDLMLPGSSRVSQKLRDARVALASFPGLCLGVWLLVFQASAWGHPGM